MKLESAFYTRNDVVQIARELIGKYVFTHFDGMTCGGIIIETEAYEGVTDRASHAFGNRRTARTEVMFAQGGVAYVYLCYGIHSLFNVVTSQAGIPHAVLVRGIIPTDGIPFMQARSGKSSLSPGSGSGPGKVSKLLGIHYSHSGIDLSGDQIWIEDRGLNPDAMILTGTRIGVAYAGSDALLQYRFWIKEALVIKK